MQKLFAPLAVLALAVSLVGCITSSDSSQPTSSSTSTTTSQSATPTSTTSQPPVNTTQPSTDTGQKQPVDDTVQVALIATGSGKGESTIGCGDSVVLVNRKVTTTGVQQALESLFAINETRYGGSGLYNSLANSDLAVKSVTIENGTTYVALTGKLLLAGVCDYPRVAAQINTTIAKATAASPQDIQVTLNAKPIAEVLNSN